MLPLVLINTALFVETKHRIKKAAIVPVCQHEYFNHLQVGNLVLNVFTHILEPAQ